MRQWPRPLLKASVVEYDLIADSAADLAVDEVSVEFVPVGDGGVADEGVIDFLARKQELICVVFTWFWRINDVNYFFLLKIPNIFSYLIDSSRWAVGYDGASPLTLIVHRFQFVFISIYLKIDFFWVYHFVVCVLIAFTEVLNFNDNVALLFNLRFDLF